jgi:lipopolysaccharide cholinephosphotransferase
VIFLNNYDSNKLKAYEIKVLDKFVSICEKNKLKYFLAYGTLLGAVRHKGFIPWDDDIDVGMPREDYEKLGILLSGKKDDKYILETPNTDSKDYYYPFSKLYDKTTTLVENTRYKIRRGIYLDIFPIDGIGNSEEDSFKNYKKIKAKSNLLLTRVTGIRSGRSVLKNIAVVVSRCIPNFVLNNKKLLLSLVNDCKKHKIDECAWCGNLVGAWGKKELMPKEIMGTPKLYLFEGKTFYGVEKPDDYLTHLYGDWRTLPPIEKRVTHHDYLECNLNESY